jgi:hypothetical protein
MSYLYESRSLLKRQCGSFLFRREVCGCITACINNYLKQSNLGSSKGILVMKLLFAFLSLSLFSLSGFAQEPKTLLQITCESRAKDLIKQHATIAKAEIAIQRLAIPLELKSALSRCARLEFYRKLDNRILGTNFENGWISSQGELWMWDPVSTPKPFAFGTSVRLTRLPSIVEDGPWGKNQLISLTGEQYGHPSLLDDHGFVYDQEGRKILGPWRKKKIVAIQGGGNFTLALDEKGKLYWWARDFYSHEEESQEMPCQQMSDQGCLSWEPSVQYTQPRLAKGLPRKERIVSFAAGDGFALAIGKSGKLYVSDRIDPSKEKISLATRFSSPGKKKLVSVHAGANSSLGVAIDEDGKLFRVVRDGAVDRHSLVLIPGPWGDQRVISAQGRGISPLLVLVEDGSVFKVDMKVRFALDPSLSDASEELKTDLEVAFLSETSQPIRGPWGNRKIVAIKASEDAFYVVDEEGSLYGWGHLDGKTAKKTRSPVLIMKSFADY